MGEVKLAVSGQELQVFSNYTMRDALSSVGCGTWDKKGYWVFPQSGVTSVVEALRGHTILATLDAQAVLKAWRHKEKRAQAYKDDWAWWVRGQREDDPEGAPLYGLPDHPFLMQHQRVCRAIADDFDAYAFFEDTGVGKTIQMLQIMEDKIKMSGRPFIVVCPKTLIKSAWMDDSRQWFPGLRVLPISRNMKAADYVDIAAGWGMEFPRGITTAGMAMTLLPLAQIYLINPEAFKADIKDIRRLPVSGIVLDESTMVRNLSDTTTVLTAYADSMQYRYALSGKPNPNGEMNYFGQMRFVDTSVFGKSFYSFRARHFETFDRFGHVWNVKEGSKELIADRVARRSISISKEECLDLPEKTYERRSIELTGKPLKIYRQMEKDCIAELSNSFLAAPMKLTVMGKLRQIAGGAVLLEDGSVEGIHLVKLVELQTVLDDIGDQQVIIWAQYRHEIRMIADHLRGNGKHVVTANSETKDVDADIAAFKSGEAQYMVAHPATLKFGVTFVKCSYAVYYSKSYDYEEYYQSHDRIYRKGQCNHCTFISLIVEDSIDEDIEDTLSDKGDDASLMERLIKRGVG